MSNHSSRSHGQVLLEYTLIIVLFLATAVAAVTLYALPAHTSPRALPASIVGASQDTPNAVATVTLSATPVVSSQR